MNIKFQNKIIRNLIRKALFLFCLIILSISTVYAQYYNEYSEEQKKKLAEAYYLVGKQYQSLGKSNYTAYFEIALSIYPELNPESIKDEPDMAVTSPIVEQIQPYKNVGELINYRFKRMATFFLAKDIPNLLNFYASAVYIGNNSTTITKEELGKAVQDLYSQFNTTGLAVDTLFVLDTINVTATENNGTEDTIFRLTVKNQSQDLAQYVSFWSKEQQYYWYKDLTGNWVVFAINAMPENLDFLRENKDILQNQEEMGIENQISSEFKRCLTYFINEDMAGVSQFLADQIEVIPLDNTLTKKDIEYTFSGYFEESEALPIDNVDNLISHIKVTYDEEYSGKYLDQVYLLEISINAEFTPQIPFWAAYNKYYFIKSESGWQIRAIG